MLGSLVLAGDGPAGPPVKKPVIGCFDPYVIKISIVSNCHFSNPNFLGGTEFACMCRRGVERLQMHWLDMPLVLPRWRL